MQAESTFGGWLKRRRGGLGLTQKELARLVGYAEITLRKVEADELRPSMRMALKLAEALQIAPEAYAQFVKFARDEPGWDEVDLPTQDLQCVTPANQSSLPASTTSFIGRDLECQQLQRLLRRTDIRLVTLTGPGGIGKTRLGLQIAASLAAEFADGACFVALASITNSLQVVTAIAQALGVRDHSDQPLLENVKAHLWTKHLLLMLDNFEHLLAAAEQVSELLQSCPRLSILVTSRTPLHLYGEHEFPVPPLARPDLQQLDSGTADLPRFLSQYAAVTLFVQRAQAAKPDFALTNENAPVVAEICVRLDGLPLAIELAAARSKFFPPQTLLALLGSILGGRLRTLTGGARDLPARQQTLRNTIAWSYNLLDKYDQAVFRRLSIFAGGFTLSAAEAVCAPLSHEYTKALVSSLPASVPTPNVIDAIASLMDKSLLSLVEQPGSAARSYPRWMMLETIREFGLEQAAASGEVDALRQEHANYYLTLVEEAEPRLQGPEREIWLERLEADHDNLRAVLDWCNREERQIDTGLRLANALWHYWRLRVQLSEARQYLEAISSRWEHANSPAAQAQALARAGWLATIHGDLVRAADLCYHGLPLARADDEKWSISLICNVQGTIARSQGDNEAASKLYAEGLAISREINDPWLVILSLGNQGILAFLQERYEESAIRLVEVLTLSDTTGDRFHYVVMLNLLGRIARKQGNYQGARCFFRSGISEYLQQGNAWSLALSLSGMAGLCAETGQVERAAQLFAAESTLRKSIHADLLPAIATDHVQTVELARMHLDSETFSAAWKIGQAMTKEQAAIYALEISDG